MRDAVAALAAAALIFFALSLLTTLHVYKKRHRKAREDEISRGRAIIVELPTDPVLTLFTEDAEHFYYGETLIDKNTIMAAMSSGVCQRLSGTMALILFAAHSS